MLDRRFIRQNPDAVRKALADKRESADLDAWLALDTEHLDILREVEELKAQRNTALPTSLATREWGKGTHDGVYQISQFSRVFQSCNVFQHLQTSFAVFTSLPQSSEVFQSLPTAANVF